jgi:hypothetical protein
MMKSLNSKVRELRLIAFGFEKEIFKSYNFLNKIRLKKGGYPARFYDEPIFSPATTATILIAKKKMGKIKRFDKRTREDINILINQFDNSSNSWKIFGGEIPSPWPTALCIRALMDLNMGNLECVKKAVKKLLDWQQAGGWGIKTGEANEVLVSYMVVKALTKYYFSYDCYKEEIKKAMSSSVAYFKKKLEDEFYKLNVSDLALSFQALQDIRPFGFVDDNSLVKISNKVLKRLHELIIADKYLEPTVMKIRIKTGEWNTFHFHPAILPILAKHGGDPSSIIKLLKWFKENFKELSNSLGMWEHFANRDNTYVTALSLWALYDFARSNFINNLKEYIEYLSSFREKEIEDTSKKIETILLRFPNVVNQLSQRYQNRATIEINDEYDVQDLLHALLKIYFDDIRREEWTPSYAGSCARMDFY